MTALYYIMIVVLALPLLVGIAMLNLYWFLICANATCPLPLPKYKNDDTK